MNQYDEQLDTSKEEKNYRSNEKNEISNLLNQALFLKSKISAIKLLKHIKDLTRILKTDGFINQIVFLLNKFKQASKWIKLLMQENRLLTIELNDKYKLNQKFDELHSVFIEIQQKYEEAKLVIIDKDKKIKNLELEICSATRKNSVDIFEIPKEKNLQNCNCKNVILNLENQISKLKQELVDLKLEVEFLSEYSNYSSNFELSLPFISSQQKITRKYINELFKLKYEECRNELNKINFTQSKQVLIENETDKYNLMTHLISNPLMEEEGESNKKTKFLDWYKKAITLRYSLDQKLNQSFEIQ